MDLNEIATKADISILLKEIKSLKEELTKNQHNSELKFIRSADVRSMLNISDGTLQRLRVSGILNPKKINGTWFYKIEELNNLLK
ncbi:MAG: helix-turn-helix domain-containing protein [Bacteroidota bacterium]